MKMNRGLLVAVTVAIGSFLQGWAYILLVGYPSYMESEARQDSLVWLVSSIGILVAVPSGKIGIGRRPLLVLSSLLYLLCSIVMLWSRNYSLILVSRFVDGFAWGFSHILITVYFLEVAPRGSFRIFLPQIGSICGVCMCFMVDEMPLVNWPGWKLILDVAFSLSLLYFILVVFCLPESPKWLVSRGRIDEAKHVLQILRGSQDVSDEMAVLVYRLKLESASSIEDYMDQDLEYGPQDLLPSDKLSKPVAPLSSTASSQQGRSIESQNATTLMDPLLTTAHGNVHGDSFTREGDDNSPVQC